MRKSACLFTATLLAGAAAVVPAIAADSGFHGSHCAPAWPLDTELLYSGQWGIHNGSTSTTALVSCGGHLEVGSDVYTIEATVYDRNPSSDVCCTMEVQRSDGSFLSSAYRCSSGYGGGFQTLSWVPPVNAAFTTNLECSIPVSSTPGVSHVTTYRVKSSP